MSGQNRVLAKLNPAICSVFQCFGLRVKGRKESCSLERRLESLSRTFLSFIPKYLIPTSQIRCKTVDFCNEYSYNFLLRTELSTQGCLPVVPFKERWATNSN